jgi:anti-anti-sigma factor
MAGIHISKSENNGTVTISIRDRFDFNAHKEFRASYREHPGISKYVINMQDVDYMDSSALGMMLLLREHAQKNSGKVIIANCNTNIRKILEIANFERLFEIQ